MDITLAYRLTIAILCVGLVVGSAEYLVISETFSDQGILAHRVIQFTLPRFRSTRFLWDRRAVSVLATMRALGAVAAVTVRPGTVPFLLAVLVAVVSHLALERRRLLGGDGSDQMNSILLSACLLAAVPWGDDRTLKIGLLFIAGQAMLSYTVSGVSKLISPVWRSGAAIPAILSTSTYGSELLSGIFGQSRLAARVTDWLVILTETCFPLILLLPPHLALIGLGLGVVFHGSIAMAMGLNTFFWAFCATYPALYWVICLLHG